MERAWNSPGGEVCGALLAPIGKLTLKKLQLLMVFRIVIKYIFYNYNNLPTQPG